MSEGAKEMEIITALFVALASSVVTALIGALGFWLVYARHLITREEAEKLVSNKDAVIVKLEHTLANLNENMNQLTLQMARFEVVIEYLNKELKNGHTKD